MHFQFFVAFTKFSEVFYHPTLQQNQILDEEELESMDGVLTQCSERSRGPSMHQQLLQASKPLSEQTNASHSGVNITTWIPFKGSRILAQARWTPNAHDNTASH